MTSLDFAVSEGTESPEENPLSTDPKPFGSGDVRSRFFGAAVTSSPSVPDTRSTTLGSPAAEHDHSAQESFLKDDRIAGYWPSERRAMLVHRFYLVSKFRREVSVEETLTSWESGGAKDWRKKKMRRDTQRQMREIERHKYFLSQHEGADVGWEAAASDWVARHSADWRDWWEQQPDSCP